MEVKSVAILGAGNGGITAAADLKSRGFEVRLYELPQFKESFQVWKKAGCINLIRNGKSELTYPDLYTVDAKEAIEGADIVMFTINSTLTELFTEISAPIISSDQIILFNGAAAMSSIRFLKKAREMGITKEFKLAELASLTYATRVFPDRATAEMSLYTKAIWFTAYPSRYTKEYIVPCRQIYDCLEPAENLWRIFLENGNPEVHPGPALLNAGRIDYAKGEFWHYVEGITPRTVNIILGVQKERQMLGKALGLEIESARDGRVRRGYFEDTDQPLDILFNTSKVFSKIKGPASVDARYITEDTTTGLVFYSDLGKVLRVPTPISDAIITLNGCLLQKDFYKEGLTLKALGLDGLNRDELIDAVS